MSWIDINNRSIFREQRAIFALMILMTAIFLAQLVTEFHWNLKVMTVPEDVVYSWNQLREGQFGSADLLTFGTLISAAFLHGSGPFWQRYRE